MRFTPYYETIILILHINTLSALPDQGKRQKSEAKLVKYSKNTNFEGL